MKNFLFLLLLSITFSACYTTPVVHRTRVTEQQITSMTGTDDDVYIYGGLGYSSWYNPISIYNNGFYSYGYHSFYGSSIYYDRHNGYYSSARYQTKIVHNHYNTTYNNKSSSPPPRMNSRQNKTTYEKQRTSTPPRGNTQQKTTQQRTITPPRNNTNSPKTTSPPRTTSSPRTSTRTGRR